MLFRSLFFKFSAKKLIFGDQCSKIISQTASHISKTVIVTLGPMGRNVLIQNDKNEPRITKDGVTVSLRHTGGSPKRCSMHLNQKISQLHESIRRRWNNNISIIDCLITEISKEMFKFWIFSSLNQTRFADRQRLRIVISQNGFPKDLNSQYSFIQESDFKKVAMIATKGDILLSDLISQAVGKSEFIKVEKSQRPNSYLQYYMGLKMVAGIPHPQFKNVGDKVQLDFPLVLIDAQGINSIQQILEVLQIAKKARKQLFLVSPKISDSVLSTFIYNKRKNIVQVYPIILSGYGTITKDYMKQLSKLTGAAIFDQYSVTSLKDVKYEHLGRAVRIQMDQIETIVYGKTDTNCSNAVIYAGGSTQAVTLQIYDKIVDALNSVQTSKKHGVVAGGGVTYWRMAQMLDKYSGQHEVGVKVVAKALRAPRKTLVQHLPDYHYALSGQGWQGYNFKTNKIQDMFQAGIIDSAAVGENVLIDSISLAKILLDIDVCIVRNDKNNESNKQVNQIQKSYTI